MNSGYLTHIQIFHTVVIHRWITHFGHWIPLHHPGHACKSDFPFFYRGNFKTVLQQCRNADFVKQLNSVFWLTVYMCHANIAVSSKRRFASLNILSVVRINIFQLREISTRGYATAKSTARPSCLVGVLYDISREKICW